MHRCEIKWIDKEGKPTADDNIATCRVVCRFPDGSEAAPLYCCAEHYARAITMSNWRVLPLTDLEPYKRYCVHALSLLGLEVSYARKGGSLSEVTDAAIATCPWPSDKRWEAWLLDSLLTGLRALEDGDKILALRCCLQVWEYRGRLGNWPSPSISDAAHMLQTELEKALPKVP